MFKWTFHYIFIIALVGKKVERERYRYFKATAQIGQTWFSTFLSCLFADKMFKVKMKAKIKKLRQQGIEMGGRGMVGVDRFRRQLQKAKKKKKI